MNGADSDVSMALTRAVAAWFDVAMAGAEKEMKVLAGVVPTSEGTESAKAVDGEGLVPEADGVDDAGVVASVAEDVVDGGRVAVNDVAVWFESARLGAEEEMREVVRVVLISDGIESSLVVDGGGLVEEEGGVDDVGMVVGLASMAEDVNGGRVVAVSDADVSMGPRSDVAAWLDVAVAGAEEIRVRVGSVPMSDDVESSVVVDGGGSVAEGEGVDDVGLTVVVVSGAEDVLDR